MKNNSLSKISQQLLVITGILGMGTVLTAPTLADNYTDSMESSQTQEMPADSMESSEMEGMPTNEANMDAGNIVEVASGNESFSTLVQAVEAAGLAETLSDSSSSYTLFAPTNEAFSQLPEGALEYLLQPENKEVLQRVLSYHVLPEAVASNEISGGEVETLDGGLVTEVEEEEVIVNNASVVNPDIEASNGVIHSINRVLLPADLQATLASELGIEETELYQ